MECKTCACVNKHSLNWNVKREGVFRIWVRISYISHVSVFLLHRTACQLNFMLKFHGSSVRFGPRIFPHFCINFSPNPMIPWFFPAFLLPCHIYRLWISKDISVTVMKILYPNILHTSEIMKLVRDEMFFFSNIRQNIAAFIKSILYVRC